MSRLLARGALLAATLLLCLLMGECAVRLLRPQKLSVWAMTRDGLVIHQRNLRGHLSDEGIRIDTNSAGMRDVEHPLEKPPGGFRILLLGDSFMEAFQVEWERSFASLLPGRLVERTGREIELINASVSGWGTDDALTYYRRYARPFAPDLVLAAITLHNDVSDNLAGEHHTLGEEGLVERPRSELAFLPFLLQRLKEWLAGNSHLNQLVANSLRAERVREGGRRLNRHVSELIRSAPSPRVEAGWTMTELLLDELARTAREDGAGVAIFLIPLELQLSDAVLQDLLERLELGDAELDLERTQAIVRAWGERRGVAVIDLLPGFRAWVEAEGDVPYLEADGHWDERGHELAAGLVARELVELGLVSGSRAGPAGDR